MPDLCRAERRSAALPAGPASPPSGGRPPRTWTRGACSSGTTCTTRTASGRGRWHVAFSVDVDEPAPTPRDSGRVVGVDLGITDLATLSTGEHVPNTRRLDRELHDLRRVQRTCARRRGPDRRTRIEPSRRWRKARARADAIHARVGNLRRNDTHQLTSRLVGDFDVIVIEDLYVAGMLRNRRLARHIAGANWAQIRRQLTYKTQCGSSPTELM
ncbi:MAG: transposase [Pseudonocardia sp.]|nr:transposase [Pseudonocardia sp.]